MALSGKIEESQVVRAAINLKKLDDPERLIKFVSDAISQYPNFATNTILIQNRARAKMDTDAYIIYPKEYDKMLDHQK